MTNPPPDWLTRLDDLLQGRHAADGDPLNAGAQLVVTNPDGTEAFRAPLARHHRLDPDQANMVWIRPIITGGSSPEPGHGADRIYNLSVNRRRALTITNARVSNGALELDLSSRQHARIEPASGTGLAELQAWDTFFYNVLTPQEQNALEALQEDSWHGRFG